MDAITLSFCLFLIILLVIFIKNQSESRVILPPSPFYIPFIGNAYLMKSMQPHKLFFRISKTYGSIITFWVGSKPIVVVNEVDMAKEALLKQDKIFAGRPQRHSGGLYSKGFKGVIIADYGEDWSKTRKLAHHALKLFGNDKMKTEELITIECTSLIERLQKQADRNEARDLSTDISLSVMNIICTMCFGTRYAYDDPEFMRLVQANTWFMQGITNASVIDAFPILRYFPCRSMQLLKDFVKVRDEILEKKFKEHEKSFDENNINDIVSYLINYTRRQNEGNGTENDGYLSRDNQIMLVGDLFIAGADTTSTSILWTLLYLAAWPEKQKKLQEQLDSVLGKDVPSLMKRTKLPYLQATIYEALRLSSLTPLGVPRKATKSTRLGKFDIPKGTTVMFNLYAMNHDSHVWVNPHEFNPERFLDDDGEFYPSRVGFMPFSAGKRVCLGESIAKMELFLILANLLQRFEFKSDRDLDLEGINGATLKPKPFKLRIFNR